MFGHVFKYNIYSYPKQSDQSPLINTKLNIENHWIKFSQDRMSLLVFIFGDDISFV